MITLDTIICCLSSCAAGIGAAFFGCVLSWADHEKRNNGGVHTRKSRRIAAFGAIGSTLFGFSSLVGLYFGPVTLVVVIRAGSLMPANAFFSQLFQLRPLTRDDYLGTMVTISGVLCFSIFGGSPAPPPTEAEFREMIRTTSAMICMLVLMAIFVLSLALSFVGRRDPLLMALGVTNIGGVSSAFMDLAAKGWSAALGHHGFDSSSGTILFWSSLGVNIFFLASMRISMIFGCKRCDVLLFVPLNTVLNIFYSVLAGMVVLQEWKQVISWPGLLGASVSVLGGVVMLITGPASGHKDDDDDDWVDEQPEDSTPLTRARLLSASPLGSRAPTQGRLDSPAGFTDEEFGAMLRTQRTQPLALPQEGMSMRKASTQFTESSFSSATPSVMHNLFSTVQRGLRPEMVELNTRHKQAFAVRKRWEKLKCRIRHMAPIEALLRSRSPSGEGDRDKDDSTEESTDELSSRDSDKEA